MTAPLTPPPPSHDPWQAPPPGDADGHRASGWMADLRADRRDGLVVTAAVTVLGVAMGLLWLWLAPRVPMVSDGRAVFLENSEGEQAAGADGTFALLGVGFGALSALGVFLYRRRGGWILVAGLALGSVLGALLAYFTGSWLGPTDDIAAHAKAVGRGVTFDGPLRLGAEGVLLVWPLVAMVTHLLLTALAGPRDPDPLPPPSV
ncbi:DUF2567 domain-containing protein [Streptomyces sp. NPDC057638]|uniref:DUF2567 domain-containing protein n=1 Tax=Streptomyces sp. NPDC057638 TaxID=3346190 RepID=UPI00367AA7F4